MATPATPTPVASTLISISSVSAELAFIAQYFSDLVQRPNPPQADKDRIKAMLDQAANDLQAASDRLKTQLGQSPIIDD
jgi:hypothetical protein